MKYTFTGLLTGIICSCAIINTASGQVTSPDVSLSSINPSPGQSKFPQTKVVDENNIASSDKEKLMEAKLTLKRLNANVKAFKANMKAVKYLQKLKTAYDAEWAFEGETFSATTIHDGITTKIVFTKKGHWLRTIKSYNGSKMPAAIKELIIRNYPNVSIMGVREVKERDESYISYFVRLEDAASYKDVVVYNGETGVYAEELKE